MGKTKKKYNGRDYLFLRLVEGATKAGPHKTKGRKGGRWREEEWSELDFTEEIEAEIALAAADKKEGEDE